MLHLRKWPSNCITNKMVQDLPGQFPVIQLKKKFPILVLLLATLHRIRETPGSNSRSKLAETLMTFFSALIQIPRHCRHLPNPF
jgi:hypothetical protein